MKQRKMKHRKAMSGGKNLLSDRIRHTGSSELDNSVGRGVALEVLKLGVE